MKETIKLIFFLFLVQLTNNIISMDILTGINNINNGANNRINNGASNNNLNKIEFPENSCNINNVNSNLCNNSCTCRACKFANGTKNSFGYSRCNTCISDPCGSTTSNFEKSVKDRSNFLCGVNKTCNTEKNSCLNICNPPRSIFIPRPAGADTARQMVGWEEYINRFTRGANYFTYAQSLSYARSFRDERIARYLFGNDSLNFSGSQVDNRNKCALLADYFGLSPQFQGQLRVDPVIQNIIWDNQFYFGLNSVLPGLYFRVHAPIVHTSWDLRACQVTESTQCPDFPMCYMSKNPAQSTCNISQALSGDFTFGDMKTPWRYGKFSDRALAITRLANIDLILGLNIHQNMFSHYGFYGIVVAPTGNKPNSKYIFEPIVGNAKHWEAGAGISGHLTLWQCFGESLKVYLNGNVTHLFKNTQCRSFDFCKNGPLSRYLLLKEFTRSDNGLAYTGNLINAINFNTRRIDSEVPIKGDISLKLAYKSKCIEADIGYNFYGNSQEKVQLNQCNFNNSDKKLYGIKGTEGVCALEYSTTNTLPSNFVSLEGKVCLNSTQNSANISSGSVLEKITDNPENIKLSNNSNIAIDSMSSSTGPIESKNVIFARNSNLPKLVSVKDLDLNSGSAGASATHKLFANLNYTFDNKLCNKKLGKDYLPFIGVGGEFEVEALACNQQTSLNQWSLWVKGGLTF